METISQEFQEKLEVVIRDQIARLGFKLFALSTIPGGDEAYRLVIELHKNYIEYAENTRLLAQNKPIEKVEF